MLAKIFILMFIAFAIIALIRWFVNAWRRAGVEAKIEEDKEIIGMADDISKKGYDNSKLKSAKRKINNFLN